MKASKKNLIEETYEVIEAINQQDKALLCEELGDVLMQVVFHAQMEAEEVPSPLKTWRTACAKSLLSGIRMCSARSR